MHDNLVRYRLHFREARRVYDLTVTREMDGFEPVFGLAMDIRGQHGWTVERVERTVGDMTHPDWRWPLPTSAAYIAQEASMPDASPATRSWPS